MSKNTISCLNILMNVKNPVPRAQGVKVKNVILQLNRRIQFLFSGLPDPSKRTVGKQAGQRQKYVKCLPVCALFNKEELLFTCTNYPGF
jgi:hypothetical protein